MSKKSKRVKQSQKRPAQPQIEILDQLVSHAQHQMVQGDFAGAIVICENVQHILSKRSPMYVEILILLGLAHAALQQYQESYDLFTEALTIDPTNAELWYNRGLASQCVTRFGQSVRDFERAVELGKNDRSEIARLSAEELVKSRQSVADEMEALGEHISLDAYIERENLFMRAMQLMRSSQWNKAEQIFRRIIEMGGRLAQYWGNLGVCLVMQQRYNDAEVAYKQSLTIDPTYPIARDNLMKLPEVRRRGDTQVEVINLASPSDVEQTFTFFEQVNDHPSSTASITIGKGGDVVKGTRTQIGRQSPRYSFFLNPYKDTRFTTCPLCQNKTRQRKFSLVIHLDPKEVLLWDKICRYCYNCDLLIVHQDKLEEQLAMYFTANYSEIIDKDCMILGTLERSESGQVLPDVLSFQETLEYLHDFKEMVSFRRVPIK